MRYSTLYHLLKGKKTTSVLSFGRLYHLLDFFHLLDRLEKRTYEEVIQQLINKHYLIRLDNEFMCLTAEGDKYIKHDLIDSLFIKEYDYFKIDDSFWLRLLFTSQVISYQSHSVKDYIPIDNDPIHQFKLKEWLNKHYSGKLSKDFFEEWQHLLTILTKEEQDVIVSRLVGYNVFSMTIDQLSKEKNQTKLMIALTHKSALHKILNHLAKESSDPLMQSLKESVEKEREQDTVDLTNYLFEQGHSIEKIAQMRRLKESTIVDHFIEINIKKECDKFLHWVRDTSLINLTHYFKENPDYKTWKYTNIKNIYPEITFYEFRFFQFAILEKGEEALCQI